MARVLRSDSAAVRYLEIMQHSLGVDRYGQGEQYRNYFATGPGDVDFDDCRALCHEGLMRDHGPQPLAGGMHCFQVTQEGKQYVADNSPEPPRDRHQDNARTRQGD